MERCISCGVETQLYYNGQPMCPSCCDAFEARLCDALAAKVEKSNAGEAEISTKNARKGRAVMAWAEL